MGQISSENRRGLARMKVARADDAESLLASTTAEMRSCVESIRGMGASAARGGEEGDGAGANLDAAVEDAEGAVARTVEAGLGFAVLGDAQGCRILITGVGAFEFEDVK